MTFIVLRTKQLQSGWSKFGPKLSWFLTHLGLIVVPLANISYFIYLWKVKDILAESNIVRSWFVTFALIGVFELFGYFAMGRVLLLIVKQMLDEEIEAEKIKLE